VRLSDSKLAIEELGYEVIEELDYALQSVEKDIKWGLRDE